LIIITLEPTYKAPRSLLYADASGKTLQSLCAGERKFSVSLLPGLAEVKGLIMKYDL